MAARQIHRRLLSLFASGQLSPAHPRAVEPLLQTPPYSSAFQKIDHCRRRFQTIAEADKPNVIPAGEGESGSVNLNSSSNLMSDTGAVEVVANIANNNESAVKINLASNLKVNPRHDTCMIFTCNVCDTRSMKLISRDSYEKGVVVARCGGCDNMHLIADRMGWFGDPSSVEDFLAARGEKVKTGAGDTVNLTLEDLVGKKNLEVSNI